MEKSEFLLKLGSNIKKLRQEKGISQAELARLCDKERASIERIENGKINPSAFVLYEVAKGGKLDLTRFFEDIE
jgi:putative transcriptional regulator